MMRLSALMALGAVALCAGGCQTLNDVASVVSGPSRASDAPQAPDATQAPVVSASAAVAPSRASGGLKGMSADGLRSAWGEPTLKRAENGAELWQYGGSGCTLLIYLYPGASNAMTVSHAEAVPGGADDASVAACAKAAGKPSLSPVS
jgi:hypothetical protein